MLNFDPQYLLTELSLPGINKANIVSNSSTMQNEQ